MEIDLAVISDLHCHHSSQTPSESMLLSDADRSPSTHHPVQALLELIQVLNIRAEALLMPGDLANKVDRQGMISGWAFIQEIANALQAKTIAATLGNHDVISRTQTDDAFQIARRLMPHFPTANERPLRDFWSQGFCVLDQEFLRILVINSVASHTNEQSAKRGLITTQRLQDISEALKALPSKPIQVAISHHHPLLHEDIGMGTDDVMENGGLLTHMLAERGFHLLVHGHKHHPKLSYVSGARTLPVFAAGSFAAGMRNGLASRTRNVFHTIKLRVDGRDVRGEITTWQFRLSKGWLPATWSAVDFPHKTGFGNYATPEALAEEIEKEFLKLNAPITQWSNVMSSMPQIQYVPPSTFEAVGHLLRQKGIDVSPFTPDLPQYIGFVQ